MTKCFTSLVSEVVVVKEKVKKNVSKTVQEVSQEVTGESGEIIEKQDDDVVDEEDSMVDRDEDRRENILAEGKEDAASGLDEEADVSLGGSAVEEEHISMKGFHKGVPRARLAQATKEEYSH